MEDEKLFMIVNPHGCLHVVSEAHARERLKQIGWRLATPDERQAYVDAQGNQRFDDPIAPPFKPQPSLDDVLTPAEMVTLPPTKKPEGAIPKRRKGNTE